MKEASDAGQRSVSLVQASEVYYDYVYLPLPVCIHAEYVCLHNYMTAFTST